MTIKTKHRLGFKQEGFATYGVSPITATNIQTYKIGNISEDQDLPMPVMNFNPLSYHNDRDISILDSGIFSLSRKLSFELVNAIPLYLAMGQSANTTPSYEQHVISGVWDSGANKFNLPSFTLHHEQRNGDVLVSEYLGCKVNSINIMGQLHKEIECEMVIMSNKFVKTGCYVLGITPIFPTVAVEKPYPFYGMIFEWAEELVGTIQSINIGIQNNLEPKYFYRETNEEFPKEIRERERIYGFNLNTIPENNTFLDNLIDQIEKGFDITLLRGTNDEIKFAFSGCKIASHGERFKVRGGKYIIPVIGQPRKCEITAKDTITSGFYPTQT